jgi:hypothetical protein
MMLNQLRPIAEDTNLAPAAKLRLMAYQQVMAIMTSEPLQKAGLHALQRHHLDLSTPLRRKAMQRVIEKRDEYEDLFAQVVQEGIAMGDFADVPPRLVTKPLQGALNWTLVWFDPERATSRQQIKKLARIIADFVVRGVRRDASERDLPIRPNGRA